MRFWLSSKKQLQLQAIYGMTVSSISWKLIGGFGVVAIHGNLRLHAGRWRIYYFDGHDRRNDETNRSVSSNGFIQRKVKRREAISKHTVNVQDNKPEGVDRIIPALKLNIRARIPSSKIGKPISYAKLVAGLTGTVNKSRPI